MVLQEKTLVNTPAIVAVPTNVQEDLKTIPVLMLPQPNVAHLVIIAKAALPAAHLTLALMSVLLNAVLVIPAPILATRDQNQYPVLPQKTEFVFLLLNAVQVVILVNITLTVL